MPRPSTPFWNNNAAPALIPGLNDRETAILDYVKEAATRFSGGKVVCSAYAPQADKDAADYVCDGTADEVEINAAIDTVKALTPSQGVSGGGVRLHGPRFNISTPIILKSSSRSAAPTGSTARSRPRPGSPGPSLTSCRRPRCR